MTQALLEVIAIEEFVRIVIGGVCLVTGLLIARKALRVYIEDREEEEVFELCFCGVQ